MWGSHSSDNICCCVWWLHRYQHSRETCCLHDQIRSFIPCRWRHNTLSVRSSCSETSGNTNPMAQPRRQESLTIPLWQPQISHIPDFFLCSTDRASLYNLVNETNLVHSLFLVYFVNFLFITSTCFRPLQVHHQEEQLYLCNTWYFVFCIADCLVFTCIPDSQPYRITSTKCCIQLFLLVMDLERPETCRSYT